MRLFIRTNGKVSSANITDFISFPARYFLALQQWNTIELEKRLRAETMFCKTRHFLALPTSIPDSFADSCWIIKRQVTYSKISVLGSVTPFRLEWTCLAGQSSKYDRVWLLSLAEISAYTVLTFWHFILRDLRFLYICYENLDVWDADVEGVLSSYWSVRLHFSLIRAADSIFFMRLHYAFQRDQRTAESCLFFSGQQGFYWDCCSVLDQQVFFGFYIHAKGCCRLEYHHVMIQSGTNVGIFQARQQQSGMIQHFVGAQLYPKHNIWSSSRPWSYCFHPTSVRFHKCFSL